jgi:hypothetical protein
MVASVRVLLIVSANPMMSNGMYGTARGHLRARRHGLRAQSRDQAGLCQLCNHRGAILIARQTATSLAWWPPLLRNNGYHEAAGTIHRTHGRAGHTYKSHWAAHPANEACKIIVMPAIRTRPQLVLWIPEHSILGSRRPPERSACHSYT